MGGEADDILWRAWLVLPGSDRELLKAIGADRWRVCDRALGACAQELIRSAGLKPMTAAEEGQCDGALGLWMPQLRVMLINESHPGFIGLDQESFSYAVSRVAWHEWGHALSIDCADEEDISAGERYVELLPEALAVFVRRAGYGRRRFTHEVIAEIYAILMLRRREGKSGRPTWLDPELYDLVRRVVGWSG